MAENEALKRTQDELNTKIQTLEAELAAEKAKQ
jgi:hypothetical protein